MAFVVQDVQHNETLAGLACSRGTQKVRCSRGSLAVRECDSSCGHERFMSKAATSSSGTTVPLAPTPAAVHCLVKESSLARHEQHSNLVPSPSGGNWWAHAVAGDLRESLRVGFRRLKGDVYLPRLGCAPSAPCGRSPSWETLLAWRLHATVPHPRFPASRFSHVNLEFSLLREDSFQLPLLGFPRSSS